MSVNVITAQQLDSIRSKVAVAPPTETTQRLQELAEKSRRRAESWPNTLEAQRARKERARQERLAADEAVRLQEDKKEAEVQAASRRLIIEKVNKMLFNETDQAKGFHSSVLHSDVLAERAAQIEFKHQIQALKTAQEAAFVRQRNEQLALAEEAEIQQLKEQKAAALAQKDAQMAQLADLRTRILAEREQNRIEGAMLRAKAAEEAQDMLAKERAARERQQQANWETKQANDALRAFKIKEAERDREADLAIEAYAANKAALQEERKRREAEREAAKEARRKAMVDLMETKFKEFMGNENARLDRDVKAADEKNAAELAERERLRREEWDSIVRSRTQQLDLRRDRANRERMADQQFAAAWKDRTKELQEEERQEAEGRRTLNKHIASFQKHQSSLKHGKKERAKIAELQEAAMLEEMANDAEERFQRYATSYIEEYQRQGKPVKPMLLQLAKKPEFMSA